MMEIWKKIESLSADKPFILQGHASVRMFEGGLELLSDIRKQERIAGREELKFQNSLKRKEMNF